MKTVWLFDPRHRDRELIDRLAAMGLSHLTDSGLPAQETMEALGIERVFPEVTLLERRVQLLRDVLDALTPFSKTTRDVLQNFIPTPLEVTTREVQQALAQIEIEPLHATVKEEERRHGSLVASLQKARERRKALAVMEGRSLTIIGAKQQRRVAAFVGALSTQNAVRLMATDRMPLTSAVSEVGRVGRTSLVQVACLPSDRETVLSVLREFGLEMIEPEAETITAQEYLARIDRQIEAFQKDLDASTARMRQLASENRRRVEVALGYWEERLSIAQSSSMLSRSKRLTVLKGFVREADLPEFQRRVAAELPEVTLEVRDPVSADSVPVSIHNPRVFQPAQTLVSMFGLPEYFTFDPTPVIFFSFLLFFGFCFGDVLYGLLLILVGWLLARKYREYPGLRNFFMLLAYGGVPTVVMGALTGAWAGDIYKPEYLGDNNILLRLNSMFMVADPVEKALAILVIALFIGMANQFLGIIMSMVRNIRQGDVKSAIFDGAFWLLLLPGVVILISSMFTTVPGALLKTATVLAITGAVGLVLTQGRAEKSYVGKVVVGVVSIYGIVGSYGVTAFIGDTLSYCRLLALGLTTGIVAMCFNMIAAMAKGIPYAGIVLFIAILVFGHLLNFVLSILGGFVHSARLTFVEFFGRFYQGGAPRFTPLGTWRGRIRVTDAATIWTEE